MINRCLYTVALLLILSVFAQAQNRDTAFRPVRVDSLIATSPTMQKQQQADSIRRLHSPKKATFRSAVLPGWGQVYNKKYWKLPLVYGALGTTGAIFVFNLKTYRELRFAYQAKFKASLRPYVFGSQTNVGPFRDSSDFYRIEPELTRLDINDLRRGRDEFRRNIDYSVLFFIVFWGLNVVDATVDAHLKTFDVNPDLSFKIKAGKSDFAGTTGVSFVLSFK